MSPVAQNRAPAAGISPFTCCLGTNGPPRAGSGCFHRTGPGHSGSGLTLRLTPGFELQSWWSKQGGWKKGSLGCDAGAAAWSRATWRTPCYQQVSGHLPRWALAPTSWFIRSQGSFLELSVTSFIFSCAFVNYLYFTA